MKRNIIISYDLISPGQDYSKVSDKIKTLGSWAKVLESLWYLRTEFTSKQVRDALAQVTDRNDKIFVAECSDAAWSNLSEEVSNFISDQWSKP